ncbi:MAG: PAS domain S-box protein [Methanoregula sp.]|uniref:sensor histidine kinase n=1 Tax=Methanoregula sp. TaxID=2052170 RepID=UPI003C70A175
MVPETSPQVMHRDNKFYQMMFELSRDAILTIEPPSWCVTACNIASVKLFNASCKEDLLTKEFPQISPHYQPDGELSLEKARRIIEHAFQEGRIVFDWRCKRFTGQEFPASIQINRIEINGEKVLQATIRDVTEEQHLKEEQQATQQQLVATEEELRVRYNELKHVENKLRASEAKYRTLTENTLDIIYSIDPQGIITYIGPQVARYGFMPEDFISHNIREIILEEDLGRILKEGKTTILTGKPIRTAFRTRDRAGNIVWFEDNSSFLVDPTGKTGVRTGVLRDITEQKETEERVRKSEELYHSLAETSQDLIYIINAQDRIEYVNSYAAAALGKTYEEIINMDRGAVFPPEISLGQQQYLNMVFATGKPSRFESQILLLGVTRWLDHALNPLKYPDGTVRAVLCISRDITDLKQTEDALKASLDAKNALLREIHHQVKNNLQVVIGLLLFQASTVSSPEIARIVLDTETRIRSMVLIHERLYKSEDFVNISLDTYIKDLVNSLICAYGTKTYINVKYSVDKIQIDQSTLLHLGLLITEVISNCIRHAFTGRSIGTISLAFHRKENNGLILSIHDDGIGIPESCLNKKASTVGLQLISLLGQDQLDGKILIERENGTTFTFTFDYTSQKEEK